MSARAHVRPGRRRLARVVDVAVPWGVGVVYGLTVLEWYDGAGLQLAGVALAAVLGGALAWRRRRPVPVAAVVLGVEPVLLLLVPVVIPFAGLAAIWSLTLVRPPRVSLVALAGLLAACSTNFVTTTAEDTLFAMALAVSVWALAEAARNRITAVQESGLRAIGDERARIARELHDVIAHSVSVIVVQASAADDVFDSRPDQARAALRSIEGVGREALRELRRVVGAVRPGEVPLPAAPQPGLAQLDELARQLRAAGLDVVVAVDGTPAPLPVGVELSAYRIVQEALTNTLRHARASVAEVTVRYGPDAVEVDVVDDGRATSSRGGDGAGFGLIGMRERAAVLGGTLDAGRTAHGGYRVHARLPVEATP